MCTHSHETVSGLKLCYKNETFVTPYAECTKLSRHSMETIEVKEVAPFTFAAVCVCGKTAVSKSIPSMLKLLDRKHK